MMAARPEFQLGIVMAGAISAGAYSAGVMDFFIEALDAYEVARDQPGWTGPAHDVRIPVLAGASAGGATAAISALQVFHKVEHVRAAVAPPPKRANRLYSSWVTDISLEALLETSDLRGGRGRGGVKSVLCADVLTRIVESAFHLEGQPRTRNWIGSKDDRSLRVMLTLTNTRGVPYSFAMFGSKARERLCMLNHGDYLDFCVGMPGRAMDAHCLDVRDKTSPGWDLFKTAALATGAFPIGHPPRTIERPPADYNQAQLVGFEDQHTHTFQTINPDNAISTWESYPFVAVDGGTIDNEPLELARRYLANLGHNDPNGQFASKAVLLVAPFPNLMQVPPGDQKDQLIHILPILISTLLQQARFKPDELAKAQDETIFSRFMISPIRSAPSDNSLAQQYPIASGTLGGFGGLLHESFRRHDYLLGRRNAQAFLRWNFALPEGNPLFDEYPEYRREDWYVRDVEGTQGSISRADEARYEPKLYANIKGGSADARGLPIIPLTKELCEPIEIGEEDLPKPGDVRRDELHARARARARAVASTLIGIDLLSFTKDMWFGSIVRGVSSHYVGGIAGKKTCDLIDKGVHCVKEAFSLPQGSSQ
jgi:Patatin-like phospholipase